MVIVNPPIKDAIDPATTTNTQLKVIEAETKVRAQSKRAIPGNRNIAGIELLTTIITT